MTLRKQGIFIEYTMKYGSLFGKVFTTENVEGVGIWLPLKNGILLHLQCCKVYKERRFKA
jgi:hypothetical protein